MTTADETKRANGYPSLMSLADRLELLEDLEDMEGVCAAMLVYNFENEHGFASDLETVLTETTLILRATWQVREKTPPTLPGAADYRALCIRSRDSRFPVATSVTFIHVTSTEIVCGWGAGSLFDAARRRDQAEVERLVAEGSCWEREQRVRDDRSNESATLDSA